MSYSERRPHIEKIEKLRNSHLITLLTTLRPGVPAQLADDQVRVVFDHLRELPEKHVDSIDVFLVSRGGESTVPWRLVSLIREYASKFNVLIPYKAMSAGSLFALGADEIVMHQLAEMGPIDPTVTNEFNPRNPATNQQMGISVEDVKSYLDFAKTHVGIESEEGRIKALELLASQVHPLALGNVERFINQARLVGEKILRTHMDGKEDAEKMNDIIENMASKLYFHGHPINRKEARADLNLAVCESPPAELEDLMMDLYLDYEAEFRMKEEFNPMSGLNAQKAAHSAAVRQAQLELATVNALLQSKQNELQIFASDPERISAVQGEIAALLAQQAQATARANAPLDATLTHEIVHACVESKACSDLYKSKRSYTVATIMTPIGAQVNVSEEILEQGWNRYRAS